MIRAKMIRSSLYGLWLGAALLIAGHPAMAQLRPAGPWQVSPVSLEGVAQARTGVKAPCIMATEFDNGFIMRLSGGGGEVMSLSIDFRQDVFTQGQTYPARLSVDQGAAHIIGGRAFGRDILIFGLREAAGLYNELQTGRVLTLEVAGSRVPFSLNSMRAGLEQLEQCYVPAGMQQTRPIPTTPNTDVYVKREAYPDFKQPSAQTMLKAEGGAGAGVTPFERPAVTPIGKASARPSPQRFGATGDVWEARAGEDIRSVLTRWADKAGTDLVWQADQNGVIAQDVSVRGRFEDAVAQVMADNAAALGIRSQFAQGGGASGAMSAQRGEDLRAVIQRWSQQNNVTLDWRAGETFTVKQPISASGDFTSALEAALTQFDDERIRPVGQLNRDPASGRTSLIIEADRSS